MIADQKRIRRTHTGQHRRVRNGSEDLVGHLPDNRVCVAVWHQARQRTATGHAEPTGIVDNNQIDPASLLALRADAGPGPSTDNRQALSAFFSESFQN